MKNLFNSEGTCVINKRKVFVVSLAICLVAILSLGTLAWFTDEDSVVNNFYVGDTNAGADEVFGIDLWEEADMNGDGNITDDERFGKGTKDDGGIVYENILPGQALDKDPYFTNTGIHSQYLRAIVTVSEADVLKQAMTPADSSNSEWFKPDRLLPGTNEKWSLAYTFYTDEDTIVLVYYYTEALEAGATTEKLFDAVVIPTGLTKELAAEMDNFSVTILGQVIQSEYLADPDAAGTMITTAERAFEVYWDEPGTVAGIEKNP